MNDTWKMRVAQRLWGPGHADLESLDDLLKSLDDLQSPAPMKSFADSLVLRYVPISLQL